MTESNREALLEDQIYTKSDLLLDGIFCDVQPIEEQQAQGNDSYAFEIHEIYHEKKVCKVFLKMSISCDELSHIEVHKAETLVFVTSVAVNQKEKVAGPYAYHAVDEMAPPFRTKVMNEQLMATYTRGVDGLLVFTFDPGINSLPLTGCASLNSGEMPGSSDVVLWIAKLLFCFNVGGCWLYKGCEVFKFNHCCSDEGMQSWTTISHIWAVNECLLVSRVSFHNIDVTNALSFILVFVKTDVYFVCTTSDQAAPRLRKGHDIGAGNANIHFTSADMLDLKDPFGDEHFLTDFSPFRMFKIDSHAIFPLKSYSIVHGDNFSKSLFEEANSISPSKLSCYCILSLDRLTIKLDLMTSFGSWIGLLCPLRAEFSWDPGICAIFVYILEDKDDFKWVGKDIILTDDILWIMSIRYNNSSQTHSLTNSSGTSNIEVSLAWLAMLVDLMYLMQEEVINGISGPISFICVSRPSMLLPLTLTLESLPAMNVTDGGIHWCICDEFDVHYSKLACSPYNLWLCATTVPELFNTVTFCNFRHIGGSNASYIFFSMQIVYHIDASSRKCCSILRIPNYCLKNNYIPDHDAYIGLGRYGDVSFTVARSFQLETSIGRCVLILGLHTNFEEFNDSLNVIFSICPEDELAIKMVMINRVVGSIEMASLHYLDGTIDMVDENILATIYHSFEFHLAAIVKSMVLVNLKRIVWDPGSNNTTYSHWLDIHEGITFWCMVRSFAFQNGAYNIAGLSLVVGTTISKGIPNI